RRGGPSASQKSPPTELIFGVYPSVSPYTVWSHIQCHCSMVCAAERRCLLARFRRQEIARCVMVTVTGFLVMVEERGFCQERPHAVHCGGCRRQRPVMCQLRCQRGGSGESRARRGARDSEPGHGASHGHFRRRHHLRPGHREGRRGSRLPGGG